MGSVPVLLVEDRGAVRVLTMNRPEKRNALNAELTKALLRESEGSRSRKASAASC